MAFLYIMAAIFINSVIFYSVPEKFLFIVATCAIFLQKVLDEKTRINNLLIKNDGQNLGWSTNGTPGGLNSLGHRIDARFGEINDDNMESFAKRFDQLDGLYGDNDHDHPGGGSNGGGGYQYRNHHHQTGGLLGGSSENNHNNTENSLNNNHNNENFDDHQLDQTENLNPNNQTNDHQINNNNNNNTNSHNSNTSSMLSNNVITITGLLIAFTIVFLEIRFSFKYNHFNILISRPFAAHCLGYPILQLGTRMQNMLSLSFNLKKRRSIRESNQGLYQEILGTTLGVESKKGRKGLSLWVWG